MRYGHFDAIAPNIVQGAHVLQGDLLGTEGSTGYVIPCPGGVHVHWEFRSEIPPSVVDGASTSGLCADETGQAACSKPTTTNSVIGEYSQAGATLRQAFVDHGGWGSVGWTVNLGSGLNMAQDFSWGKLQDFQHDPDGLGGGVDNTLTVRASDQTHAYLVDSVFWATWAGANPRLGLPLADRGSCPAGFNRACISYQPFQFGFVWMDAFTGRTAVFCPDVSHNGVFDSNDIALIDGAFGTSNPDYDVNGDGVVNQSDHDLAASSSLDPDGDGLSNGAELGTFHTNPCKADTDGDNCADNKELGSDHAHGGERSPTDRWDFYDVPYPALWRGYTGQAPDGGIGTTSDKVALLDYMGASAGTSRYEQDMDGNGVPDGVQYDRTKSADPNRGWLSGAPDGSIGVTSDLLAMASSIPTTCTS